MNKINLSYKAITKRFLDFYKISFIYIIISLTFNFNQEILI